MEENIKQYTSRLITLLEDFDWKEVEELGDAIQNIWKSEKHLFVCGNGGSAANADHAVNDFIYGVNPKGEGVKAFSLAANFSVNSCLANDTGYENIFSHQLNTLGERDDLLLVFSGSGNSKNILKVIRKAKSKGMMTSGILGFDGGEAKKHLDIAIHFPINDMQIAEDLQMIVIHMIVQNLRTF